MARLTKSLSPERQAAAHAFIARVVRDRFAGNVTAAARAIGISQAMLYEVLQGTRGPGTKVLEGIADLEGVPLDEVIGRRVPAARGSETLRVVRPDEASAVQAQPVRSLSAEQWYARIKVAAEELDVPPQTLHRKNNNSS